MAIKVNNEVIDAIRSLERSYRGVTKSYFTQYEPVKIRDGVYQHLEAIYLQDDGEQRALLLIQLLQKDTILSVEKSSLQKINWPSLTSSLKGFYCHLFCWVNTGPGRWSSKAKYLGG